MFYVYLFRYKEQGKGLITSVKTGGEELKQELVRQIYAECYNMLVEKAISPISFCLLDKLEFDKRLTSSQIARVEAESLDNETILYGGRLIWRAQMTFGEVEKKQEKNQKK